jgi:hypothetical protein
MARRRRRNRPKKPASWPTHYPWSLLPRTGARRFVPPRRDWVRNPPRGPKHGYLDHKGNEWVPHPPSPGSSGDFHWDVQHPDGAHTNVTPEGNVHHGDDNFWSEVIRECHSRVQAR